jgi:hypothetical protein
METKTEVKKRWRDILWKIFQFPLRLIGMTIIPRRSLKILIPTGNYLTPLIFVAISFTALKLVMLPEIQTQYASDEFRNWYMELRDVTEEAARKDIDRMSRYAPLMLLIEGPLTVFASTALIAFVIVIAGRLTFKIQLQYRPALTMVAWASIISALPMLINLALKLNNQQSELTTDLSALLTPELVGGYFSRFVAIVDPFLIWQVWLLSIGVSWLYVVNMQRAISVVGTIFVCFGVINAMFGG